jgi:hypothetical protein
VEVFSVYPLLLDNYLRSLGKGVVLVNLFFVTFIILFLVLYLAKKRDIYISTLEVKFLLFRIKIVNKQIGSEHDRTMSEPNKNTK